MAASCMIKVCAISFSDGFRDDLVVKQRQRLERKSGCALSNNVLNASRMSSACEMTCRLAVTD
jgi:hypothetical protein